MKPDDKVKVIAYYIPVEKYKGVELIADDSVTPFTLSDLYPDGMWITTANGDVLSVDAIRPNQALFT